MHFVSPTADSFYNEFQNFIAAYSEPVPGVSPYTQYKVQELAKGKVVVTLDGQGADEMLGGYSYFYGSYLKELLTTFKLYSFFKESSAYLNKNASNGIFAYLIYYLLPVGLKNYAGSKKYGSAASDFYQRYHKMSTITTDLYHAPTLHDFFLQHFEHKLEHLLKWDDLSSMNFSIESRTPFLDHHLVEKTLSLSADHVLKNGVSKHILRESVKDILPEKIYNRYDKKGFSTPSDEWFRTKSFREYIINLLNSESFRQRGYFDVEDCKRKYERHLSGKTDLSKDIWKWINLEVWFQQFIDKK